jgi:hypothetical protein
VCFPFSTKLTKIIAVNIEIQQIRKKKIEHILKTRRVRIVQKTEMITLTLKSQLQVDQCKTPAPINLNFNSF